jgi:hypothetical protein
MRMKASPNLANIYCDNISRLMHQLCHSSLRIRCPSVAFRGLTFQLTHRVLYLLTIHVVIFSQHLRRQQKGTL